MSTLYAIRLGIYDLDRTEVLQGPQALFFGKNSPGGVISLISADPGQSFEAKLRGGYEFTARQKYIEGTVSGPLSDNLGARLDVYHSAQSGWFINDAKPLPAYPILAVLGGGFTEPTLGAAHPRGPQEQDTFIRGTLKYAVPGVFDAKLKLSYTNTSEQDGVTSASQFYACPLGATLYVVDLNTAGSRDCKLDQHYNESRWPASFSKLTPLAGNGDPYIQFRSYCGHREWNRYVNSHACGSSGRLPSTADRCFAAYRQILRSAREGGEVNRARIAHVLAHGIVENVFLVSGISGLAMFAPAVL